MPGANTGLAEQQIISIVQLKAEHQTQHQTQ